MFSLAWLSSNRATSTQLDCEHCASLPVQLSTHDEVMENTSLREGNFPDSIIKTYNNNKT